MTGLSEPAIPLPVSDDRGRLAAARRRCGCPELPGFFVTEINDLARRIADRIVAPGREAVHLTVACPGKTAACLGHKATEVGIGEHIRPGGRRTLATPQGDDILPSVHTETTHAVVKEPRLSDRLRRVACTGTERSAKNIRPDALACAYRFRTGQLLDQRPVAIAKNHASGRFEQHVLLRREVCSVAQEYPTRLIRRVRPGRSEPTLRASRAGRRLRHSARLDPPPDRTRANNGALVEPAASMAALSPN